MSVAVRFARTAYRGLLSHATRVARESRSEAIGWLLGYFAPGQVTVLDAMPATRYKSQSRYGAEADPREELEIATAYPRSVGIVGLYHSHPFKDETQHAIFHSQTDDRMLRSRASRQEDYLSVVTDGHEAEVFVLRGGKTAVQPEVVDGLSYRSSLRRYVCAVSLRVTETLEGSGMEGLLGSVERAMSREVEAALRKAGTTFDPKSGVFEVPGLRGSAARNSIRVSKAPSRATVDLEVATEVAVYLPEGDREDILAVLKQEIQDDIVYLLWHGLDARVLSGPVADLEANLGSLHVQETDPLPKKLYRPSKRALVLKKGAPSVG